ncbi:MAG: indole-3-glycerol phosphate synthase TrpC [Verrucomicrobia bacterium]|nr:indole-3-glycerol phosphate synthase TrpC [Verrucomicrobiota bacterium]
MSILDEIVANRRAEVSRQRAAGDPLRMARSAEASSGRTPHRFRKALQATERVNIIAEFKRGSPSAGTINATADPAERAMCYQRAGACAISVLTEQRFFRGSLADLREVRAATSLPILRKDFIVDEYQIDEAAVARADAVLLIVAVLSPKELSRLRVRAETELGMDALVEVHMREELDCALECGASLIGVNNRDLHTFHTSIDVSLELASLAPAQAMMVSESGISSGEQVRRLRQCGYSAFVIGEPLMRVTNPAPLIRDLQNSNKTANA